MERYKASPVAKRLVPQVIRGRFGRKQRSYHAAGIGDLRVSRCESKRGAGRNRIDIRIREATCEQFGFVKGMPVVIDYEALEDRVVFQVSQCDQHEGVSLSHNKNSGNGDLRASFSGDPESVDSLFGERLVFSCDVTSEFGDPTTACVKFVCDLNL